MSEMLVRMVDKTDPEDIYKDVKLTKRGDVIVVRENGWDWSLEERTNPQWRIARVPVPLAEAEAMLTPELPIDETDERETLQRRGFGLALDSVPPLATRFAARVTEIVEITVDEFYALKFQKPLVQDPERPYEP